MSEHYANGRPQAFVAARARSLSFARARCSSISRSGFRGEVFFKLSLLIPVVVGVSRCLFLGGDIRPFFRILAVKLKPLLKSGLGIGLDRIHRAFRLRSEERRVGKECRCRSLEDV